MEQFFNFLRYVGLVDQPCAQGASMPQTSSSQEQPTVGSASLSTGSTSAGSSGSTGGWSNDGGSGRPRPGTSPTKCTTIATYSSLTSSTSGSPPAAPVLPPQPTSTKRTAARPAASKAAATKAEKSEQVLALRRDKKRLQAQKDRLAVKQQIQDAEAHVAQLQRQLESLEVENERLKLHNNVMDSAVETFSALYGKILQWRLATGQEHLGGQDPYSWLPQTMPLTMLGEEYQHHLRPASPEDGQRMSQLSCMNIQDFAGVWKQVVMEAAGLLLCMDKQMATEADVQAMFQRCVVLCEECCSVNLVLMSSVWTVNLETGKHCPAPASHWQGVAASLNLSDQQIKEARLLQNWITDQMGKMLPEVQLLQQRLDVQLSGGPVASQDNPDQLVEELQALTRRHYYAIRMSKCTVCRRILNPRQGLLVLVNSWPWKTDPAALLCALAQLPLTN